ncbi:MAG: serine protease [Thermoleophilaceae bacterium]
MTAKTIALLAGLMCVMAGAAPSAHAQRAGSSIVGGAAAPIEAHPYQVYVTIGGYFCGGSIRDKMHVVTAAHCVIDEISGYPRIVSPGSVRVAFGEDDLSAVAPSQVRTVSSVALDRRYLRRINGSEYDSAVLTLTSEIPETPSSKPIDLVDPAVDGASLETGDPATVSGFGVTSEGVPSRSLRAVGVPLAGDPFCQDAYGLDFVASAMTCAGGVAGEDSCFGDSGGPLVVDTETAPKLAGIVSFGSENCGDPNFPGVNTEVAEPGTRRFLSAAGPVAAPAVSFVDPVVRGRLEVGSDVSCAAPGEPGEATQFFFSAVNAAGTATGLSAASSPVFRVPAAAASQRLVCDVRYETDGGLGYATGTPTAATVSFRAGVAPLSTVFDTTRPRSRISRVRCSGRVCITTLTASDAAPGSVRSLIVTLAHSRTKCRGRGVERSCRKERVSRRLRAGALGGSRYRVVAGRLTPRRYRISVVATDTAGNRQARAATRLFRVSRRG